MFLSRVPPVTAIDRPSKPVNPSMWPVKVGWSANHPSLLCLANPHVLEDSSPSQFSPRTYQLVLGPTDLHPRSLCRGGLLEAHWIPPVSLEPSLSGTKLAFTLMALASWPQLMFMYSNVVRFRLLAIRGFGDSLSFCLIAAFFVTFKSSAPTQNPHYDSCWQPNPHSKLSLPLSNRYSPGCLRGGSSDQTPMRFDLGAQIQHWIRFVLIFLPCGNLLFHALESFPVSTSFFGEISNLLATNLVTLRPCPAVCSNDCDYSPVVECDYQDQPSYIPQSPTDTSSVPQRVSYSPWIKTASSLSYTTLGFLQGSALVAEAGQWGREAKPWS